MDAVGDFLLAPAVQAPVAKEGTEAVVMFANNNPGEVSDALFQSFVTLSQYDAHTRHHLGGFVTLRSGACISIFRNKIVEAFLGTDLRWLWFVDSDIMLNEDTLEKLMEVADEKERPVVGANYFMNLGVNTVTPSMFYRKRFPDGSVKMAPVWQVGEDWPQDKLIKCDGMGMGCTLIYRGVLIEMLEKYGHPEPWFAQEYIDNAVHGEDLTFCHRVKELGYPLYVHTGIEVGHVKMMLLDPKQLHP